METEILTAFITGGLALLGTLTTVYCQQRKFRDDIMSQLERHNAIQDERIRTLTEKVEQHNRVIERTFVLEGKMECLSNRVTDLANNQ